MATFWERKNKSRETVYCAKVRLKGHRSLARTFKRKTDAKKWAQQTEADIYKGRIFKVVESKRHTFGDMIQKYLEDILPHKSASMERDQSTQLGWWEDQLGNELLSDVTPLMISQCRDKLLKEKGLRGKKRSKSTAVRYLSALSHVYTIAIREWGWADSSPMKKVSKPKEPRGRVRVLSDEERMALLTSCRLQKDNTLYCIVVLALSTGARKNEILQLKWGDVDLDRGSALIEDTKNNERRSLPIVGRALEILSSRHQGRRQDTSLIFPNTDGDKPFNLRNPWESVLKDAGIKDFRFHDLRHCAASYLA
ncbi:MAG: integrase, partial [Nitrospinales bacterium]